MTENFDFFNDVEAKIGYVFFQAAEQVKLNIVGFESIFSLFYIIFLSISCICILLMKRYNEILPFI